MLAAYLVCLIVGGVFVGLSVLSGLGKDVDGGVDHDVGAHAGGGHAGGGHAGGGHAGASDDGGQGEHAGHLAAGHAHEAHAAHAPGETGPVSEAAQAGRPRPWLPFTSFRFWTFGSFLFGGTGLALTELAATGEPMAALTALGVGVVGGTASAALVRSLRRPVGATATRASWIGATGELLAPLGPGGVSKIRAAARGRARDLMVTLGDAHAAALPKGTRVVVIGVADDGVAQVEAESAFFQGGSALVTTADVGEGTGEGTERASRAARDEEVES